MAQDKKVDYEQLRRKQDSDSEKSRILSEKIEFCENDGADLLFALLGE